MAHDGIYSNGGGESRSTEAAHKLRGLLSRPVIDRASFRETFGGVGPPTPQRLLRLGVQASRLLHLQPTNAGWVDMGMLSPLMDTTRIRVLGWPPQHSAPTHCASSSPRCSVARADAGRCCSPAASPCRTSAGDPGARCGGVRLSRRAPRPGRRAAGTRPRRPGRRLRLGWVPATVRPPGVAAGGPLGVRADQPGALG